MLCNYCGLELSVDETSFEQRSGIITDGPDNELIEEIFVIAAASCPKCGNHNQSVVADDSIMEDLDYDNNCAGRNATSGGREPL